MSKKATRSPRLREAKHEEVQSSMVSTERAPMNMKSVDKKVAQTARLSEKACQAATPPLVSIVTPAYNEEHNLPIFYQRLSQALASVDMDWELIVVDDHSSDGTFAAAGEIAGRDSRVRALRFSRNF